MILSWMLQLLMLNREHLENYPTIWNICICYLYLLHYHDCNDCNILHENSNWSFVYDIYELHCLGELTVSCHCSMLMQSIKGPKRLKIICLESMNYILAYIWHFMSPTIRGINFLLSAIM